MWMSKTLMIGCSHLSGSYSSDNRLLDIDVNYGTIARDILNDKDWKIISCPGEGIIAFSSIIETLYQQNLLQQFDNVILQQTYEPRLNIQINQNQIMQDIIEYVSSDDSLPHLARNDWLVSMHPSTQFEKHKSRFPKHELEFLEYCHYIGDNFDKTSDVVKHVQSTAQPYRSYFKNMEVDVSFRYIEMLLANLNINLYTFRWWNCWRDTDYIKSVTSIIDDTMGNKLRDHFGADLVNQLSNPGAHLSLTGIKYAGAELAAALENHGFR